jgi:hypothetical protein
MMAVGWRKGEGKGNRKEDRNSGTINSDISNKRRGSDRVQSSYRSDRKH